MELDRIVVDMRPLLIRLHPAGIPSPSAAGPGPGHQSGGTRADGGGSQERRDKGCEGGPFYPPKYFLDRFGITAEQLRKAKQQGQIRTRQPKPRIRRYHYSEPDARNLWPHAFAKTPQNRKT